MRRRIVAAIAFMGPVVLSATVAGATITSLDPSAAQVPAGQSRSVAVRVAPGNLSVCLRTLGAPPAVRVSLSGTTCADHEFTATMTVAVEAGARPGRSTITVEEFERATGARVDSRPWTLTIPTATTTTTTVATTTTTAVAATTVTTIAAVTTTAPAVVATAPPEPDTSGRRRVAAERGHGSARGAPPWWLAFSALVPFTIGTGVIVRRRRTAVAKPDVETIPPVAVAVAALRAGLASPSGPVTVAWGRAVALRAGAIAAPDRRVRFRWTVTDVQAADAGRWLAWPAGRAAGGLRTRRGQAAGDHHDGAQALLLHPYLPAVGDAALVKLGVEATDGVTVSEFPAWLRCERSAQWEVTYSVVHALAAPEAPDAAARDAPRVLADARVDLRAPDGPWLAGEQLVLSVDWDGDDAIDCQWTGSAGAFPAGASGATVVFEVPRPQPNCERVDALAVVATVTHRASGDVRVVQLERSVTSHRVLIVDDLLTGALTAGGAPVWPPPGTDPLAGARAAAAALKLSPDAPPLTPVPGEHHHRARDVIGAAGHEIVGVAYDWRLAPRDAADAVATAIERAQAGGAPVTVVAHGTGGLALRARLHGSRAAHAVDDAIFVGTPHHGMPVAYRWLRFGGGFGPAGTSRLADAVDAIAAAAGRDVVGSWPVLYAALPRDAWFGAGPVLHDRVTGAGWITDSRRTYTDGPGALPEPMPSPAPVEDDALVAGDVRLHIVVGGGIPTECLYSYGPTSTLGSALTDPAGADFTGLLPGAPEVRTLIHGDESLVMTLLDGDGVVPAGSAAAALAADVWRDECRVHGVAHEDLLDDSDVLAYIVYVIEHLG